MENNQANIFNIWKKAKMKIIKKYKEKKSLKLPKKLFKFFLGVLVFLGFLQYSAIFPFLDKVNIPHDFDINVFEPKILKFPVELVKENETEKDYNTFLEENSDEISNGIYTSKFTNSPYIEIVISNNKKLNCLNSIDVYEYRKEYKNPLKVVNFPIDDAALQRELDIDTISDETLDSRSFIKTFENSDGNTIIYYFTPASAFPIKNTPSIFYLVFNQGIGNIIQRHYIVSYYQDVNKGIFEKIDSSELNSLDFLYKIHKKYNTDKSVNIDLMNVMEGYYYLNDILNSK